MPPLPLPVPLAGGCDHWAQGQGPGALHWSPLGRNQQPRGNQSGGVSPLEEILSPLLALCLPPRATRPGGDGTVSPLFSGYETTHILGELEMRGSCIVLGSTHTRGNQVAHCHSTMSKTVSPTTNGAVSEAPWMTKPLETRHGNTGPSPWWGRLLTLLRWLCLRPACRPLVK